MEQYPILSNAPIAEALIVEDRGRAVRGHHLDLFMDSREEALEWGVRWINVSPTFKDKWNRICVCFRSEKTYFRIAYPW